MDDVGGRFAFDSVGDAKCTDIYKARAQLQTLEGMLKPEQINQIGSALDERDKLMGKNYVSVEQFLEVGKGLVPEFAWSEFEKRARAYYEKQ